MKRVLYVCLGLSLCAGLGACQSVKPAPAEKPINFSEVVPKEVFRGGQPTNAQLAYLQEQYGIKTIVKLDFDEEEDLDDKKGKEKSERVMAKILGMEMVFAPTPPSTKLIGKSGKELNPATPPDSKSIQMAVEALKDRSKWPIYVHCIHGRDRTGLVVGLFRVLSEGKKLEEVRAEMDARGFNTTLGFVHPLVGLADYWKAFEATGGKQLPPMQPQALE